MYRNTAPGYQDVGTGKVVVLAKWRHRAFVHYVAGRQFSPPHAGVREQGAETTINIDAVIGFARSGMHRQCVKLFFVFLKVHGHGLEGQGALLEIHGHQVLAADLAAIFNGFPEIEGVVVGMGHDVAVNGAGQGLGGLLTHPLAGNETFQD